MALLKRPVVTIVGAGIVGAMTAYFLAKAGARVRIVDSAAAPGRGVSGASFGWVNTISMNPEDNPALYRLCQDARVQYDKLNEAFSGDLTGPPQGSLFWRDSPAETQEWGKMHQAAGTRVAFAGAAGILKRVAGVVSPPPLAIVSTGDYAFNVSGAITTLLSAAKDNGAEILMNRAVSGVQVRNGQVIAVSMSGGAAKTDYAVVAAGTAIPEILSEFVGKTAVTGSQAALVTLSAKDLPPAPVMKGPGLEFRRSSESTILVPRSYDETMSAEAIRNDALESVRSIYSDLEGLKVASAVIRDRPMTPNGLPFSGPLKYISNLFLAVGHPGVILAPYIAQLITKRIMGGAE